MRVNQLGKSDIFISEFTLGCMSLGTDKNKAKYIIDAALDGGVNHLDTADLYDFGRNEEIIGDVIRHKRQQLIVTTKVGNHFNQNDKTWYWDPSKKYILQSVKNSLRRLQTDYIDVYMLHGGTIDDPIDETIEAFEQLKQEGIIRAYGISSIRPNVIREYVNKSSIDAVMMQYSLLDRRPEEKMLDYLKDNSISVLARGPLAKGILTTKGKTIIQEKANSGFLNYSFEELQNLLHTLNEMTSDQMTMNQLALGFVLNQTAITSVVFGASSEKQVQENIIKPTMSIETYHRLKQLTKQNYYDLHR